MAITPIGLTTHMLNKRALGDAFEYTRILTKIHTHLFVCLPPCSPRSEKWTQTQLGELSL